MQSKSWCFPGQLLVLMLAGWINRHQQAVIAYQREETKVLRNLTDAVDGFLIGKTHVIMDRDPVFTARVRDMLWHAGTKSVRLPRRSPNLNAFIERVIPFGKAHLRELKREYLLHYHIERPHQGLDLRLLQPADDHAADGPLVRQERLGDLLNSYYREAA